MPTLFGRSAFTKPGVFSGVVRTDSFSEALKPMRKSLQDKHIPCLVENTKHLAVTSFKEQHAAGLDFHLIPRCNRYYARKSLRMRSTYDQPTV